MINSCLLCNRSFLFMKMDYNSNFVHLHSKCDCEEFASFIYYEIRRNNFTLVNLRIKIYDKPISYFASSELLYFHELQVKISNDDFKSICNSKENIEMFLTKDSIRNFEILK